MYKVQGMYINERLNQSSFRVKWKLMFSFNMSFQDLPHTCWWSFNLSSESAWPLCVTLCFSGRPGAVRAGHAHPAPGDRVGAESAHGEQSGLQPQLQAVSDTATLCWCYAT